jgi:hypothetical protein
MLRVMDEHELKLTPREVIQLEHALDRGDEVAPRTALLGEQVRVKLDEQVIVTGRLLGFGDCGTVEILEDDGFVHYCWPLLSMEEYFPAEEE